MFLGGFPLGAIFGLQTLIQVPFELGTDYLEDQIESATREHMWKQGALKAISELETQRQNQIQQAVLNQVKKSEFDMKQMEQIVEGARALPNTQMNIRASTSLLHQTAMGEVTMADGWSYTVDQNLVTDGGDKRFEMIKRFLEEKKNIDKLKIMEDLEGVGFRFKWKVERDVDLEEYIEEDLNGIFELLRNERGQNYEIFVNGIPVFEEGIVNERIKKGDDISIAPEDLGTKWAVDDLRIVITQMSSYKKRITEGFKQKDRELLYYYYNLYDSKINFKRNWKVNLESKNSLHAFFLFSESLRILKECDSSVDYTRFKESDPTTRIIEPDIYNMFYRLKNGELFELTDGSLKKIYGNIWWYLKNHKADEKLFRELDLLFNEQLKIQVDEYTHLGEKRDISYASIPLSFAIAKYESTLLATLFGLSKCDYRFRFVKENIGFASGPTIRALAEKGENYDINPLLTSIKTIHKPRLISLVGQNDFESYFAPILQEFKSSIIAFNERKWLKGGTRAILIRNILSFKTKDNIFPRMELDHINKILFRNLRYGKGYRSPYIRDFLKHNKGGASIDMLRYNIESLIEEDFERLGYRITDKELDNFKIHSLKKIRDWRIKNDASFKLDLQRKGPRFNRKNAQILALRWVYRTVVAYEIERRGHSRNYRHDYPYIQIKGLSYKKMAETLEDFRFNRKFVVRPSRTGFSEFMNDLPLKKEYLDEIRKEIKHIKDFFSTRLMFRERSVYTEEEKMKVKRLKWKYSLAQKTEERLKLLAYLDVYYKEEGDLYSKQFNAKIHEIPKTLDDFKEHLEDTSDRKGYFDSDVYKKKNTAKIYYSGSAFSAGPFTTNIDHVDYKKRLFPQLKNPNSGILKVKNNADKNILQSIMDVADPAKNPVPKFWITKYQNQPHHYHFIPEAFKNKHVVATEVPVKVYNEKKDSLIIGIIDMVMIIGKNIYICDYKPERDFSLNPSGVENIFADTIPQVSTYALIFSLMFADEIKKGGYNVYTFTFNKDDGVVADPYVSLKLYTEFYETFKSDKEAPPWKWVLEQYKAYWKP